MKKAYRRLALVSAILLLFAILFSELFIICKSDHYCIGDECPICYAISVCENVLKAFGLAAAVAVLSAFVGTFMLFLPSLTERVAGSISLVTLKVKLSN